MIAPLRDEALAEDALLLHFGDTIDEATSARVLAAAAAIARHLPSLECVPAYASLLLRFEPPAWRGDAGDTPHARVRAAVADVLAAADVAHATAREVVIPVLYGGAHGPDLGAMARHAGLAEAEVIARHVAGHYRVAMLGFAPGFPYLLGLDPRLAVPRRADPRARVPAGSVAIGGAQTGIYPESLPGGWQLIGRTPLTMFDMRATPPSRLQPGDQVRFEVIDAARFDALQERDA